MKFKATWFIYLLGKVVEGKIGKIYVHSPDRLSRKHKHLITLFEKFQKAGAKVIFLNCQIDDSPESRLLDIQGIAA
ncbi:recombinase family protein [Wolbachia endosymbiont of Mansonella ozzardi]|nr:recombinase family protein [Wolbachia endosymbiont of Mansonella ozzardi]